MRQHTSQQQLYSIVTVFLHDITTLSKTSFTVHQISSKSSTFTTLLWRQFFSVAHYPRHDYPTMQHKVMLQRFLHVMHGYCKYVVNKKDNSRLFELREHTSSHPRVFQERTGFGLFCLRLRIFSSLGTSYSLILFVYVIAFIFLLTMT